MHKQFAEWYRSVSIEPNDDLLKNRWAGIENYLKLDLTASDIVELVRLFFNIPVNNDGFYTQFIDCFTNIDSAFQRKFALEISVLAGSTLITLIENEDDFSVFATLLTCCIAFNKREAVVPDIYEIIRNEYINYSVSIRENLFINKEENIKFPSVKKLSDHLKVNEAASWDSNLSSMLNEYLISLNSYLSKAQKTNQGIEESIKIYTEDSQILWWLVGEWSKDLNQPFKELSPIEASLIIGKELADLVDNSPGPYSAEAVLHKMIGYCKKGANQNLIFADAVEAADIEWRKAVLEEYASQNLKEITPILTAISKSLEVENSKEWLPAFKGATKLEADKIKLSSRELAFQMYLECLTIKCLTNLRDN